MANVRNGKVRFNLYIPEKIANRIKSDAEDLGISMNSFVVTLFANYYNGLDASKNTEALKAILKDFADGLKNMDSEKLEGAKADFDQLNFYVP